MFTPCLYISINVSDFVMMMMVMILTFHAGLVVSGLRTRRPGNQGSLFNRSKIFVFKASRPALGLIAHIIQCIPGSVFLGVNVARA